MNWIIQNICCFNFHYNNENKFDYRALDDNICKTNKKLYDLLMYHDLELLRQIDIYDLYLYIYVSNIYDFQKWKLNDCWIIDLYNGLVKKSPTDFVYINAIISKLMTYYLFFHNQHNKTCYNFLIFRKELFDFNLWVELILNPSFNNDDIILDITNKLHRNNIIDVFVQFNYYNFNYNLLELILLGKIRFDTNTNKLVFVRFFNTQSVLNLINRLNIVCLYNSNLLNDFKELGKNDKIDKDYINTVIDIINPKI
jgi:hypothetical protein